MVESWNMSAWRVLTRQLGRFKLDPSMSVCGGGCTLRGGGQATSQIFISSTDNPSLEPPSSEHRLREPAFRVSLPRIVGKPTDVQSMSMIADSAMRLLCIATPDNRHALLAGVPDSTGGNLFAHRHFHNSGVGVIASAQTAAERTVLAMALASTMGKTV